MPLLKIQTRDTAFVVSTRKAFNFSRFYRTRTRPLHQHHRDSYNYTYLLEHCKTNKSIKKLHAQIIVGGFEQNPFTATKLVGKYMECECDDSSVGVARKVFDNLPQRDVFCWNVIIQGYANWGPCLEAIDMYSRMRLGGLSANCYTYSFVLKACGLLGDRNKGQIVHGHAVKSGFELDLYVGNALVAFYSKCKDVETSRKVFDEMPKRDLISWNSIISGYNSNGYVDEALQVFRAMLRDQYFPNQTTLISTLPACVKKSAIQVGFWIHSYILKLGMEVDASLGNGLISMYANCGQVSIAKEVFLQIKDKNLDIWSAIIRCCGMHGHASEALQMFSEFLESGLELDGVMILCLLLACSHAGMVTEGCRVFEKMELYGVEKNEKHYACMVDLFGRAGFIEQAVEFVKTMPLQPGKDVYGALLGACRIHNEMEIAEETAKKLLALDPENSMGYLSLAHMYEDAGQWEEAARLRKELREKKIRKLTGTSSI
ncbi:hypothetical protein UlMin_039712 [Ulmus minor]